MDGSVGAFIEAEQYTSLNGRFREAASNSRSAGKYMTIPGTGKHSDPNTFLTFNLKVTNGGTFYVWLLGYGPDDSSDSFFIQADSGSSSLAVLVRGKWGWKKASSTVSLSAGAHIFKVKNREDGSSVDKILLTRDKSFTPSGLGRDALAAQCS